MKRTKLQDRPFPNYSRGEEIANAVTHIAGGALAVVAMVVCLCVAAWHRDPCAVVSGAVYGLCLVALYTMSGVYHGLKRSTAKKVMQVLDHCTIYFLIAGTYTVVSLSALRPVYPALGWGLFAAQWALTALAVTLTAIDLKVYAVFSMVCYICMGWAILPFMKQALYVLTEPGFWLLLLGGIAYTIGAVLYGLGSRRKWMHSIFHLFVILGSALQFFCIVLYVV